MHFVRTTMQPHKVICVGEAEFSQLTREGLIYAEESGAEPSLSKPKADSKSATIKKGA